MPSTSSGHGGVELRIGDIEEGTGLVVDSEILPFVQKLQKKETSHIRTGKAWSLLERATVMMANSQGVGDGKNKAEQVKKFLSKRAGWDESKRSCLNFLAQLSKLRRHQT